MNRVIIILGFTIFYFDGFSQTGTYNDSRDGKVYKSIKIGTQIWIAENLAYKAKIGCWAYNNSSNNVPKYGYLYSWETAKKICPAGWHLPSDAEWDTLTNYLGGEEIAGVKMLATSNWIYDPGRNDSIKSGFNALPAGHRDSEAEFSGHGYSADFWSITPLNSQYVWVRSLNDDGRYIVQRYGYYTTGAYSVRCIKN
jgi:uncharacterized protein (TIGR02145 family)